MRARAADWEERYEGRYGFWRSSADKAVGGYLDCGILENGFARVRCGVCRTEFLVAFSCKGRGLCPSCAAKRAAALAAFLREEVLAEVGHAQWVFAIPKMLRPYFLHHRPLLGRLCQAAYDTAREMIGAASGFDVLRQAYVQLRGMPAAQQTIQDLDQNRKSFKFEFFEVQADPRPHAFVRTTPTDGGPPGGRPSRAP